MNLKGLRGQTQDIGNLGPGCMMEDFKKGWRIIL